MASNPYVNKVVYDNNTLIDITDTTAVASDVASGKFFYGADGSKIEGTASGGITLSSGAYLFYAGNRIDQMNELITALAPENRTISNMFYRNSFTNFVFPNYYDTSLIEDMSYLFGTCQKLLSLDVSNLKTDSATIFNSMFQSLTSLPNLDLSHFDTSNVETMNSMFMSSKLLTTLDLSNFDFNKVENIANFFSGCEALTSVIIGKNDTSFSSITQSANMFAGCSSLSSIIINGIDVLPATATSCFTNLKSNCQIKVPSNLVNAYKTATNWSTRASYISAI